MYAVYKYPERSLMAGLLNSGHDQHPHGDANGAIPNLAAGPDMQN